MCSNIAGGFEDFRSYREQNGREKSDRTGRMTEKGQKATDIGASPRN